MEIAKIRQEVGTTAPWLKLKRIKRVSDLPMQLPTTPTDRIGEPARKEDRATDWLTALWDIACKSRRWDEPENRRLNTGSIVFYAFPQQVVDLVVERTGGRPITVALPNLIDGEVTIDHDGSVYLVDEVSDGAGSFVRRDGR